MIATEVNYKQTQAQKAMEFSLYERGLNQVGVLDQTPNN